MVRMHAILAVHLPLCENIRIFKNILSILQSISYIGLDLILHIHIPFVMFVGPNLGKGNTFPKKITSKALNTIIEIYFQLYNLPLLLDGKLVSHLTIL